MADAPDFGIFRLIVEDVDTTLLALKGHGFVTDVTEVVAVEISDRPGALAEVLDSLAQNSVNVEYMYAFLTECIGKAIVFFRFEDADLAISSLAASGIHPIGPDELFALAEGRPETAGSGGQ